MNVVLPLLGLAVWAFSRKPSATTTTATPPKPTEPGPDLAPPGEVPATPSQVPWPTPTTVPVPPAGIPAGVTVHPLLKRGMRGAEVLDWQNFLGAKSLDGVFGPETESLVRAYQTSRALPVDGVIGPQTWAARDAKRPAIIAPRQDAPYVPAGSPPAAPAPGPVTAAVTPPGATAHPVLRRGSKGADVLGWQNFLGAKSLDGAFGPETESLVKAYQMSRALPADGIIGPATWAARDKALPVVVKPEEAHPVVAVPAAMPAPDGGQTSVPFTPATPLANAERERETIKKGSKGVDVVDWQKFLGVTADGIFGAGTDAATKKFQTKSGLKADGIVGKQTWAAARAAGG